MFANANSSQDATVTNNFKSHDTFASIKNASHVATVTKKLQFEASFSLNATVGNKTTRHDATITKLTTSHDGTGTNKTTSHVAIVTNKTSRHDVAVINKETSHDATVTN